jgi:hypothetical protein
MGYEEICGNGKEEREEEEGDINILEEEESCERTEKLRMEGTKDMMMSPP